MPPTSPDSLPWYRVLSIDLLIRVAKATFLNPVLTWLYPLALRAQAFHYHMSPLKYGIFFALFVDFCWLLSYINSRARNGWRKTPRHVATRTDDGAAHGAEAEDVDQETEEVVVVTGGSSGLGQIIAEMFALKGVTVAVMDIKKPPMEGNYSIEYYECDVSDADAVHRTAKQITQDVSPRSVSFRLPFPFECEPLACICVFIPWFLDFWILIVARDSHDASELCGLNHLRQEIDRIVNRNYSKRDWNEHSGKLLYHQGILAWNATSRQGTYRHRLKCPRLLRTRQPM